ncbi:MAG: DUF3791 domain-containing protein [Clostridiales bacterium]|jgi:hypothetical protein|nr:DUF3791 domain-containing protein [Clostridiales bacterium]
MVKINHELFLQVHIANLYMRRHNLTKEQFLELDRECDILRFLEIGYEPYHLTGDEGVLDEIDEIVDEQLAAKMGGPATGERLRNADSSRRAPDGKLVFMFLASRGL